MASILDEILDGDESEEEFEFAKAVEANEDAGEGGGGQNESTTAVATEEGGGNSTASSRRTNDVSEKRRIGSRSERSLERRRGEKADIRRGARSDGSNGRTTRRLNSSRRPTDRRDRGTCQKMFFVI